MPNYDMEELLDLAGQAGFVPPVAQGPQPAIGPGLAPSFEPTAEPSLLGGQEDAKYEGILQGGLTIDPGLASSIPGVGGPPDAPGSFSTGFMSKEGTSRGAGVNASGARFNDATAKKLDARGTALDKKLKQTELDVAEQFRPVLDAQAQAAESGADAVKSQVDAQIQMNEQGQRNALTLKAVNDELEGRIKKIHADNTARENIAKTEYLTRFRNFAQMQVDPQKFWKDSTVGQQLGSIAVAFVHDFLGAKGIKTSGLDSIKMAVERNIAGQIEAIKHGGQVAEGFRQIYEMERAQSQSEMETFDRIKPYFMEAVKQKIIAETLPYESMLASANGKAALAKLDQELAKNLGDVFQHMAQNTNVRRQQEISIEQEKARLAVEKWSVGVRAQEANLRQKQYDDAVKAAQGKAEAERQGDIVFDPEDNKGKFLFRPGRSDTEKAKIREQIVGAAEVNREMSKLRELGRKIGDGKLRDDIKPGSRFSDEDVREYEAIRQRLAHAMVKANGERATEKDVDQYLKSLPMSTALTNGGVAHITAWSHQMALDKVNDLKQQHLIDLPTKDWVEGAKGEFFTVGTAEAKASYEEAKRGVKTTQTDKAIKQLEAGGYKSAGDGTFEELGVDRDSEEMNWKTHGPKTKGDMPRYAVAVSALAEAAKGGKDKQAMDKLVELATQDPRDTRGGKYKPVEGIESLEDQVILMNWAQWKVFEITGQNVQTEPEAGGKRRPVNAGYGDRGPEMSEGATGEAESEINTGLYRFRKGVGKLRGNR